jgi:outer membrane protein assembly factor BamA
MIRNYKCMKFSRYFLLIFLIPLINPLNAQFSGGGGGGSMELDSTKKLKIAALPIINYDPSFGFIVGAFGMGFYRVQKGDTISPPSVTGAMAIYTQNKTWAAIAFQKFYFNEDRWRITAAVGLADVNFQVYSDLLPGGGGFIGYNTSATFVFLKVQRAVIPDLFAGIHYKYYRANTAFDIPGIPAETGFNDFHALGVNGEYDSRDNINNPGEGWNIPLDISFFNEALGSTNNYNTYELSINNYFGFSEGNILATRFHLAVSAGDVPFTGQNVVQGTDIRGYTNGKHRGNQLYALQAEYRWTFYKKWGAVFFGGVATVADKASELSFDGLLPAVGTGIRYMAIPSENINIGIDIATGKEDWGIYFNITEAF